MKSREDVDQGWAWLVLLASYFNLLLCSGLAYVAGMFQLVFLTQFQGSVALTSWVTALFSSLMQLAGPLSSLVANCFNCRVSVMLGGAFMALGLLASSMTSSLEMLLVTFGVIAGVGLGFTYTASIVIINYFFVQKRTLVTGIAFSASGLGLVITPQVSQLLFENFSWRESLAILGGAAAQVCVMGALMSPVHEVKVQQETGRRFCCYCASGRENQKVECEYHVGKENEDESLMQMHPLSSIDENTENLNSDTEKETSDINRCKETPQLRCPDSVPGKKCHLHVEDKGSCVSSQASNHQLPEAKDSTRSIPSRAEKIDPESYSPMADKKSRPPSSGASLFGSLKEIIDSTGSPKLTGSHQELSSGLLLLPRIRALKGAESTRSHQELSDRHRQPFHASSNPQLSRRLDLARSGSIGASRTSIQSPEEVMSQGQIVVISRSPSIMGLIPSATPLEVIFPSGQEFQSDASLHSGSVFESRIFLNTAAVPVVKDTKPSGLSEDVASRGENAGSGYKSKGFPPLYRNVRFWVLCLSLFVANAGCGIFNIHFPGFIQDKGLTDHQVTNVLSVNGFALLFGRCLCAALANSVKGNDLLIYWALHVLGGICVCLMPSLGQGYASLVVLVYGVGSYYGTVYAVLSPMTIEMVGLTRLATAFGIEMVCAGLGYFVSPPLAGLLVDITNSYDYSMYCGGILFIIGGTIIFCIPLLGHSSGHLTYADVTLSGCEHERLSDDQNTSCSTEDCGVKNGAA